MIKRWLANLGLAVVVGVVWIFGVLALSLTNSDGGERGIGNLWSSLLYGFVEFAFFAVVPLVLYLVIGEAIWKRVGSPRAASIVLGALVVGGFALAVTAGSLAGTPEAIVWLLAFAGFGAIFGAIARLPARASVRDIR